MSWLILVLVWLVISVATATRGFSGGGVECYSVLVLYYCIMDTYVSGEPVYSLMFRPGRYDYGDYGFWRDVWSTDDVKLGSVMIGNVGIDESVPGVVSYKPAD